MVYLVECHCDNRMVCKYRAGDGFILVLLLRSYDVFEDGMKYEFILRLFITSEVWFEAGIEGGISLGLLITC